MRQIAALIAVVACVATADANVTMVDPGWEAPTLYYEAAGLIPDKLNWGFDGALYVGNNTKYVDVPIHRVSSALTGAAYGDALYDPDTAVHYPDGSVYVGGGHCVWRIPPGPGAAVLVTDDFVLEPEPHVLLRAPNGDLLADDYDRIVRVEADGRLTPVVENIGAPGPMAFDASGNLYFAVGGRSGVARVAYPPSTSAVDASALPVLASGYGYINSLDVLDDGRLLVADSSGVSTDSIWLTSVGVGNARLAYVPPVTGNVHSLAAVEGPDGAIYISDGWNGEEAVFRVARLPEPASALALLATAVLACRRR